MPSNDRNEEEGAYAAHPFAQDGFLHGGALPLALAALALALPTSGAGFMDLDDNSPAQLPDIDVRESVAPTADQLAAASALGARVEWNSLGAPSSVFRLDGPLATGVSATDAASAARSWLSANATLFGLSSTDSLAVWSSSPFAGSDDAYAVSFRQRSGDTESTDGIATVAVSGSRAAGWKITYASSTLSREQAATGSFALAPATAWAQAADDAGASVSAWTCSPSRRRTTSRR